MRAEPQVVRGRASHCSQPDENGGTHSHIQTFASNPIDHIGAGVVDISGTAGADDHQDLAQLVWKYFGEEISETLTEVQEAFALQSGHVNS
jgi:hypothetical protein